MMTMLLVDVGGPLTLIFAAILTAMIGAALGATIGSMVGRTDSDRSFATTIRITRERLATATDDLERGASALAHEARSDAAGAATVLRSRVAEIAKDLGAIERGITRRKEASP
ncbi:MAG: hypothetical protein ACYDDF_14655 [Thermoplasmatota archaeon]